MTSFGIGLFVQVVALALWMGGIGFLSFISAPIAFRKSPSRKLATDLVGSMLARFNLWEMSCAIGLFVGAGALYLSHSERALLGVDIAISGAMLVLLLIYVVGLTPRLDRLTVTLHQEDEAGTAGTNTPLRRKFRRLHTTYVVLMGANFVLAIVLAGIIALIAAKSTLVIETAAPQSGAFGGGFGGF